MPKIVKRSTAKSARGRPKGRKFVKRTTVGLTADLVDHIDARAHEEGVKLSESIRRCLVDHFASQEELRQGVVRVRIAAQDMDDLRKVIRNGLVSDEPFALTDAVRRYLEWLRQEARARKEILGTV